jgi:hypothetical protein
VSHSPLAQDADALFVSEGDRLIPTDRAVGPWSPDALHGGPVAALVARAIEQHPGGDHLQLVRITLELVRPVPFGPLTVTSSLVKPGSRTQLVDVVVEAGGVDVAWARGLRILRADDEQRAEPTVPEDPPPDPPDRAASTGMDIGSWTAFHNRGVELRFVRGANAALGPATVWIRLRCPVVAGEEPSPWQRAAAAADFGNGVSAELEFGSSSFINPDLTVALHRLPVGEWICLDARTRFGSPGIGAAESALWDTEGRIGHALQNLVVQVRS